MIAYVGRNYINRELKRWVKENSKKELVSFALMPWADSFQFDIHIVYKAKK